MTRFLFSAGILALLASGCAKAPQTVEFPVARALFDKSNTAEPILLRVEGRLYNESESTVFTDYTADLVLLDKSGKEILTLGIRKDNVYPFARTAVAAEKRFTKESFAAVASALSIDQAELEKKGEIAPAEIGDNGYKLKNIKSRRRDVVDVLKEGKK
jgi:hypothetical protein